MPILLLDPDNAEYLKNLTTLESTTRFASYPDNYFRMCYRMCCLVRIIKCIMYLCNITATTGMTMEFTYQRISNYCSSEILIYNKKLQPSIFINRPRPILYAYHKWTNLAPKCLFCETSEDWVKWHFTTSSCR